MALFGPCLESIDLGLAVLLTHLQPLIGGLTVDLSLNVIERTDAMWRTNTPFRETMMA